MDAHECRVLADRIQRHADYLDQEAQKILRGPWKKL
jgi:hypothetical protein